MHSKQLSLGMLLYISDELTQNILFEGIQREELIILLRSWEIEQFEAGQFIEKSGDKATCFYILLSGQVAILKKDSDSKDIKIIEIDNKTSFDWDKYVLLWEMWYYTKHHKRMFSLQAETQTQLCKIYYQTFDLFIKKNPQIWENIIKLANERYHFSKEQSDKLFY